MRYELGRSGGKQRDFNSERRRTHHPKPSLLRVGDPFPTPLRRPVKRRNGPNPVVEAVTSGVRAASVIGVGVLGSEGLLHFNSHGHDTGHDAGFMAPANFIAIDGGVLPPFFHTPYHSPNIDSGNLPNHPDINRADTLGIIFTPDNAQKVITTAGEIGANIIGGILNPAGCTPQPREDLSPTIVPGGDIYVTPDGTAYNPTPEQTTTLTTLRIQQSQRLTTELNRIHPDGNGAGDYTALGFINVAPNKTAEGSTISYLAFRVRDKQPQITPLGNDAFRLKIPDNAELLYFDNQTLHAIPVPSYDGPFAKDVRLVYNARFKQIEYHLDGRDPNDPIGLVHDMIVAHVPLGQAKKGELLGKLRLDLLPTPTPSATPEQSQPDNAILRASAKQTNEAETPSPTITPSPTKDSPTDTPPTPPTVTSSPTPGPTVAPVTSTPSPTIKASAIPPHTDEATITNTPPPSPEATATVAATKTAGESFQSVQTELKTSLQIMNPDDSMQIKDSTENVVALAVIKGPYALHSDYPGVDMVALLSQGLDDIKKWDPTFWDDAVSHGGIFAIADSPTFFGVYPNIGSAWNYINSSGGIDNAKQSHLLSGKGPAVILLNGKTAFDPNSSQFVENRFDLDMVSRIVHERFNIEANRDGATSFELYKKSYRNASLWVQKHVNDPNEARVIQKLLDLFYYQAME